MIHFLRMRAPFLSLASLVVVMMISLSGGPAWATKNPTRGWKAQLCTWLGLQRHPAHVTVLLKQAKQLRPSISEIQSSSPATKKYDGWIIQETMKAPGTIPVSSYLALSKKVVKDDMRSELALQYSLAKDAAKRFSARDVVRVAKSAVYNFRHDAIIIATSRGQYPRWSFEDLSYLMKKALFPESKNAIKELMYLKQQGSSYKPNEWL